MKNMLLLPLILTSLLGCKSPDNIEPNPWRLEPGKPFTLSEGKSAVWALKDFDMVFIGVTADSRCPENTQCIWAGQVTVKIAVSEGNQTDTLLLSTPVYDGRGASNNVDFQGVNIRLIDVTPYPKLNPPAKVNYEASFEVN